MTESEKVKIFACNIRGSGSADKVAQVRARSSGSDFIVLNEINKQPGDESTMDLRCQANVISNSPASGNGPGFGSFFGMKMFDPDKGDSIEVDDFFEIGVMKRHLANGTVVSVIGNYRSPNMPAVDMLKFYSKIDLFVETCVASGSDLVFVIGDDNSHPTSSNFLTKRAFEKLEGVRKKYGGE